MGMLSFAARSLDAQRFGLEVVGQNIANVNTEGYSKRVAEFAAVAPPERWSAGGGVEIVGARSMRDRLIDRRLRFELSDQERERAVNDQLGVIEVALGDTGDSLDAALDGFYDAWATLADTPTSPTSRQEVILQGQALSGTFGDIANRLSESQRDVDTRIRANVEQVNALADRIAKLNIEVAGTSATSPEGLHVRDDINKAVEELSNLLDLNVIETENGGYTVEFAGGHPLVVGQFSYPITITDAPFTGFAQLRSAGVDVTSAVKSGSIGGLLDVRDAKLPDYMSRLDALANDVATSVNTIHSAGYGLNGSTGVPFFQMGTPPGASTLSVSAMLTATGGENLVAAAGVAATPGDNTAARQLANLRDATITGGGTATANEGWSQLVYRVGRDKQLAFDSLGMQTEVTRQIQNLQDGVSGVSLDEEAADLMRFQRAYEANARFFSTVNDTLTTLLNMVGV
jgi:flagellar hook-associated protein 1 FlgK